MNEKKKNLPKVRLNPSEPSSDVEIDDTVLWRRQIRKQNHIIARLESELRTLRDKISLLDAENKNLSEYLSKSKENQNEVLNQSLESRNQEIVTLRNFNLDFQTEILEKNRKITFLEENILQINNEFSLKESELTLKIEEITEDLDNTNCSLQTATDKNFKLLKSLEDSKQLEQDFCTLQLSYERLCKAKRDSDLSVTEMKDYMNLTAVEEEKLFQRNLFLTRQVSSLKTENKFLIDQVVSLNKQLHELAEIQEHTSIYPPYLNNYEELIVESPRSDGLLKKALEQILHLQRLNWSLQQDNNEINANNCIANTLNTSQ